MTDWEDEARIASVPLIERTLAISRSISEAGIANSRDVLLGTLQELFLEGARWQKALQPALSPRIVVDHDSIDYEKLSKCGDLELIEQLVQGSWPEVEKLK